MKRLLSGIALVNVALLALPACEIHSISSNITPGSGGSGGATASSTAGVGGAATTSGTGGAAASSTSGAGGATATSGAGGGVACAPEAAHVYAISTDKKLYRLDYVSAQPWATTLVGDLACATSADPYSIAVDRSGLAWVVYADGNLFKVDTTTAACTATTFAPGQHGFTTFSVAFASDAPGGDTETLYASGTATSGSAAGLATIDRSTLTLTPVGNYDVPAASAPVTGPVQLAGGSDAKLSGGYLLNGGYYFGQFDPTSAHVLETASDPSLLIHDFPAATRYAIIPWGKYFWIFVTVSGGMKSYFYDHDGGAISSTNGPASETAVPLLALSASTCATANQLP